MNETAKRLNQYVFDILVQHGAECINPVLQESVAVLNRLESENAELRDRIKELESDRAIVQAATAEECAKVCELQQAELRAWYHHHVEIGAEKCAAAIRKHARTKYQDQTKSGEKA